MAPLDHGGSDRVMDIGKARADVAKFMVDMVADAQWDGSPGVLLGGKKRGN